MRWYSRLVIGIASGPLFGVAAISAGPIDAARHPHQEKIELVHEAKHSVDHAWEIYHQAALGGTIASPALQAEIEQHLHEARTLLPIAQEAAGRGDRRNVERLVGQIRVHAGRAVEGSKEQKR
jgi:hypothetical protein